MVKRFLRTSQQQVTRETKRILTSSEIAGVYHVVYHGTCGQELVIDWVLELACVGATGQTVMNNKLWSKGIEQ